MIFIVALLACIVVEGSALDISLRCNKVFYKLDNDPVPVTQTAVKIPLQNAGVPDNADEVVVFTSVRTGYLTARSDDYVVVDFLDAQDSVIDTKKLFYSTYDQSALSYNSENMEFPFKSGVSSAVQAKLAQGHSVGQHFRAYVQVTGYYTTHCELTS